MARAALPKVGVYQQRVPHYRHGVFARLCQRVDMEVWICAPANADEEFASVARASSRYHWHPTTTWYLRIPFRGAGIAWQPSCLAALVRGQYDVIVHLSNVWRLDIWLVLAMGRVLRRPVVLWGHGRSQPERRMTIAARSLQIAMARAFVFYEDADRDAWVGRGADPQKLFVAHNTIDTDAVVVAQSRADPDRVRAFLDQRGLARKRLVLFPGRLVQAKRPDIALRCMPGILAAHPDAALVFMGDGPALGALRQLAEELGVCSSTFFAGSVHNEEEAALYWAATAVAVLPRHVGLAVHHAFWYGVPIVIGDDMEHSGPEARIVRDNVTGVVCRDGDVGAFSEAVCSLLADEPRRLAMGCAARSLVKERYTAENMANGLAAAITFVLRGRRQK